MFGLAKDRWPGAVHSQSQPLTLPPTDLPLGRTDSVGVSMEAQMTCDEATDANTKLVVMETHSARNTDVFREEHTSSFVA